MQYKIILGGINMKEIILTTAKVTAAVGLSLYSIGAKEKLASTLHSKKKDLLNTDNTTIHVVEAVKATSNKSVQTEPLKEIVKQQFNAMVNTATLGATATAEHVVKSSQRNEMNQLYGQGARLYEDTKQKYKK